MKIENKKVWLLGSKNPNADRDISWEQPNFPNLADPDIIIVDLTSLTSDVLERLHLDKFQDMATKLFNKFINGGDIIFIIEKEEKQTRGRSNLDLCPVSFGLNQESEGRNVKVIKSQNFILPYFDKVKKFYYFLDWFRTSEFANQYVLPTNEITETVLDLMRSESELLELLVTPLARDNSGNTISAECSIKINGYWQSGRAIYLPRIAERPSIESVETILEILGKKRQRESLPEWVYTIELPGIKEANQKISELKEKKLNIENEINLRIKEQNMLQNHYRLLASRDRPLEEAVYEAFKIIGFEEIYKKRSPEKEDWVIDFRTLSHYRHGVIEVKGSDTKTDLKDLRQCDNWVSDYLEFQDTKVKGILISNQYRHKPYPDSKLDRFRFEPSEIQFAQPRGICIIPSCEIFELVRETLQSDKIKRSYLEKTIAKTDGLIDKGILFRETECGEQPTN